MKDITKNAVELFCVICGKKFIRLKKPTRGARSSVARPSHTYCCSKECSKKLVRLRNRITSVERRRAGK